MKCLKLARISLMNVPLLVEPASKFSMLHSCMKANFYQNIKNSGTLNGKDFCETTKQK